MKKFLKLLCVPLAMYGVLKFFGTQAGMAKIIKPGAVASLPAPLAHGGLVPVMPEKGLAADYRIYGGFLNQWQRRMQLERWNIALRVTSRAEMCEKADACTSWNDSQKTAVMRVLCSRDLRREYIPNPLPYYREDLIIHELTHLLYEPLYEKHVSDDPHLEVLTERTAETLHTCRRCDVPTITKVFHDDIQRYSLSKVSPEMTNSLAGQLGQAVAFLNGSDIAEVQNKNPRWVSAENP